MIYEKLYNWQKKIVDELYARQSYGLFLDCGLGKTPVSLAFAEKNNCSKILIISINGKAIETKDVRGSWFDWASKMKLSYNLKNKKSDSFDSNSPEVFLINYESLFKKRKKGEINKKEKVTLKENVVEFIKSCKGHNVAIIVDESHKMKDTSSVQTNAIMTIKSELKRISNRVYCYLLTGTPFTAGYEDIYSQLKMLGCDMTKTAYLDNFCVRGNVRGLTAWQQPIVGYKNLDQLYRLIHQYAITIKSDDVIDLPERVDVYHNYSTSIDFKMYCSEKIRKSYLEKYLKQRKVDYEIEVTKDIQVNNPFYRNIDFPNESYMADTVAANYLRARQLSIGFQGNAEKYIWFDRTRLNELKSFLEKNEENYLLFYNYTPELIEIYNICEELGYNIDVYCGEIKSLAFYNKYENMNESDKLMNKKNIILANFASGSTGLNWQAYSQCILFSCPVYKDYEQGIKRIRRNGQKETTVYHYFYQDNWLDRKMTKALEQKVDYSDDMFEEDFNRVKELFSLEDD